MNRRIYGVRHGEYAEEVSPYGLTNRGKEQVARAADKLSETLGRDALILTAQPQRAVETAKIIATVLGITEERILQSKRLTAAGREEQTGIPHFGALIEGVLRNVETPHEGLVVVGSKPLIEKANNDQEVGFGELVVYEYDPDSKSSDGKYPPERHAGSASIARLNAIVEDWQLSE